MADRQQFVSAYTQLLAKAWSDPSYQQELESNPKQALSEVGLDTGSATVDVVTTTSGSGNLDEQVQLYESGVESGTLTLYVPPSPPGEAADVNINQLERKGKGDDDVTVCCCCCPCCTCT